MLFKPKAAPECLLYPGSEKHMQKGTEMTLYKFSDDLPTLGIPNIMYDYIVQELGQEQAEEHFEKYVKWKVYN